MYESSRLIFDPVKHEYSVEGKILPSVTRLLPKQDYFVSDERLAECAAEGTANHKEIEEFLRTGISTSPMTDAMFNFMDDHRGIIGDLKTCETSLFSEKGFAGTPDIIFENAIVDLKRTCGNKKIHGLQTAGYNLLAVENKLIKPTKLHYILVLNSDGKYNVTNVYDSMAENIFLGLLSKYKIEKSLEYYLNKI